MSFEVQEPIQNTPFEKPQRYWFIQEGETPQLREGRRPAVIFPPRDQKEPWQTDEKLLRPSKEYPSGYELVLVNRVREQLEKWREQGYPGVSRTTLELIAWWTREGREKRLFFAQLEAALAVIFLIEARADFLQGITVPRDEPSDERKAEGYAGFQRYACKMATGSGKTTVMAMLSAWSILNKVNDRGNARFSDVVLVVCPNVTIRRRLGELDPEHGEASIYRTRDLVPSHLMPLLTQGRVLVSNWHVFEPQTPQAGGVGGRVMKAGVPVTATERLVEKLLEAIRPDISEGEAPEIPRYEASRHQGSTQDVDYWTSREAIPIERSHVNFVVPDTKRWEQSAAYYIDKHETVHSFVKNAGLGFAIPYIHNAQAHDYMPDFIIRLKSDSPLHMILETKGYDPLEEVKRAAAERWVTAVNADGKYGKWLYRLTKKPTDVGGILTAAIP